MILTIKLHECTRASIDDGSTYDGDGDDDFHSYFEDFWGEDDWDHLGKHKEWGIYDSDDESRCLDFRSLTSSKLQEWSKEKQTRIQWVTLGMPLGYPQEDKEFIAAISRQGWTFQHDEESV